MTDYTKSYNGAAKDAAEALILGSDFDTEFDAIEVAVASKSNKLVPSTPGNICALSASGDLQDTGVPLSSAELSILDGATVTTAELNKLDGLTSSTAELNILDGVTATAAEINRLDGITATTTELNYTDGVTSSIQTQLNDLDTGKADATTSAILALVAAGAAGSVGTYVFAASTTASDVAFGATRAGSALNPTASPNQGTDAAATTLSFSATEGTALSGTWRCMGTYDHEFGSTNYTVFGATLWLRIS